MIMKCFKCNGIGATIGMGMISKKCDKCNGEGSISLIKEPETVKHQITGIQKDLQVTEIPIEIEKPKRKRGRPKKTNKIVKNEE